MPPVTASPADAGLQARSSVGGFPEPTDRGDPVPDDHRGLGHSTLQQRRGRHGVDPGDQIDPVEDRPREPAQVAVPLAEEAETVVVVAPEVAARAGVAFRVCLGCSGAALSSRTEGAPVSIQRPHLPPLLCALLALLLLPGCRPGAEIEGDEAGECDDGVDNDQDGVADCDDPGCAVAAICVSPASSSRRSGPLPDLRPLELALARYISGLSKRCASIISAHQGREAKSDLKYDVLTLPDMTGDSLPELGVRAACYQYPFGFIEAELIVHAPGYSVSLGESGLGPFDGYLNTSGKMFASRREHGYGESTVSGPLTCVNTEIEWNPTTRRLAAARTWRREKTRLDRDCLEEVRPSPPPPRPSVQANRGRADAGSSRPAHATRSGGEAAARSPSRKEDGLDRAIDWGVGKVTPESTGAIRNLQNEAVRFIIDPKADVYSLMDAAKAASR